MSKASIIGAIAMSAMLVSGCSTRPRNFAASVSTPVASRTAFEADYRTCQALVAHGRTNDFKAGAATALATGAGAVGGGAAVVGLGVGGTISGAGMAAAAAMPVVGILAGFGVSRAIRGGKERKLKRNMTACLGEFGYEVEGWERIKKKEDSASIAANRVPIGEPAPDLPASPVPPIADAGTIN